MIWLVLALVALAVLAPLLFVLRGRGGAQGARAPALELHRSQLRELERDLADGRIMPDEHKTAVLEVQRRLLAAGALTEPPARVGSRWPVVLTVVAVPIVGAALYLASGARPGMPSGADAVTLEQAREDQLVETLRQRLAGMDPKDERTRTGYRLLGNAEAARGRYAAAAAAFRSALDGGFDPDVAYGAAESAVRAEGRVSDVSAGLFRRALAASPDAPWRAAAEARLAEQRTRSSSSDVDGGQPPR